MPSGRLLLIHGRHDPDETLDDWGFNGPTLEGVEYLVVTYNSHYRLGFVDEASFLRAKELTGWEEWDDKQLLMQFHDDMVHTKDGYFGDWEVQFNG